MTLASTVRSSWHEFLESFEGLRPELYRFCRHLTRSPWDAEDLAQDVLARAFVTLGNDGTSPLFLAAIEATEEAIYNSLLRATTVVGRDGNRAEALPIDRTVEILEKHGVIARRGARR